jgi:hypothetical protein
MGKRGQKESNSNSNIQNSHTENKDVSYNNVGHVFNAPVNNQVITNDNSSTYDIDKKDTELIEQLSRYLIDHFGEKKITIGAIVLFLLGGVQVSFGFNFDVLPKVPTNFITPLLYSGIVFLIGGAVLWGLVQYKYDSRCVNCKTFYSMKEVGEPKAKEVSTKNGVRRTVTRHYKCENCGNEANQKFNEFVPDNLYP